MQVEELVNIGPVSARWLHGIGIHTRKDLEKTGALLSYKILELQKPEEVSVMLLYALHGALLDIHVTKLPDSVKKKSEA